MHCLAYLKPQDTLSSTSGTEVTSATTRARQNTPDTPAKQNIAFTAPSRDPGRADPQVRSTDAHGPEATAACAYSMILHETTAACYLY